jgi:hypothetical protein
VKRLLERRASHRRQRRNGRSCARWIDAGADAIKARVCNPTRIVAGAWAFPLLAIMDAGEPRRRPGGLLDGACTGRCRQGITGGGRPTIMIGISRAPPEAGETFSYQGRAYKSYRGTGSAGRRDGGSADRYFQQDIGRPDETARRQSKARWFKRPGWRRDPPAWHMGSRRFSAATGSANDRRSATRASQCDHGCRTERKPRPMTIDAGSN